MYDEKNEDYEILLWPLYFTSFLIDDFFDDEGMFGAGTAILSSASSRTSSALAYLLHQRDGIEVVGLTSPRNVEFTESLGVYDKVVPYEEIESLDRQPAVYADMSGDAKVRSAVHGHFDDELRHSAAVGITHREDLGGGSDARRPERRSSSSPPTGCRSATRTGGRRSSIGGWPNRGVPTSTGPAAGSGSSAARAPRTSSASTARCSTASPTRPSGTCSRPATDPA